jgi:branched-chain amino acid transport system substrate-binding protein
MTTTGLGISRRDTLKLALAGTAASLLPTRFAIGQMAKLRIGILLPYSGTYSPLGEAITNAMELRFAEIGGRLGGREVELVKVDSEAKPEKAAELTTKLINQEKVDILCGPVHSGVAMAMAKIAREEQTITVVSNAGADQITGALCAPNIFRSSFTNWQPGYPMGKVLAAEGKKTAVLCFWNYGAGQESAQGFKDGFEPAGGTIVKEIGVPFPQVEFQAALSEIASLKPDAVYTFFAGGGAVKFVKDWHAAGLKGIELVGAGFLTEGVTQAQGEAAEGLRTTLHYADSLDNPTNKKFRKAYKDKFGKEADVYAVQGYDAAELIRIGVDAVKGDVKAKAEVIKAMEAASFDSPRGPFKLSKAHNPIQNIYLRQVQKGDNVVIGLAEAALADPAKGCKMG